jgi:arabinan endo-1,5-alpha-L-arabinosidase
VKPRTGHGLILSCVIAAGCGTDTLDLLPPESSASGANASGGSSSDEGGRGGSTARGTTAAGAGGVANGTIAGAPNGGTSVATAPNTGLLHRYDFSGTGTTVADLAGDSSAKVLGGASLDGSGQLSITDGVSYVELKSWILSFSGVTSITIAVWLTWQGGASWQRIFDFGAMEDGGSTPGDAVAQFYMTPEFVPGPGFSTFLDGHTDEANNAEVLSSEPFPVDVPAFVAVVVEGNDVIGTSTLRMYLNGIEVGTPATAKLRLTELRDQNCWLGRSLWSQDNTPFTHYRGTFDEFRIYGRALSAEELGKLSPDVIP